MLRKTGYESPQVLQQVSVLLEEILLGDSQNVVQSDSSITTTYPWKVSSCSLYAPGYQLDETITIALSDAGQKLVSSIELDVSDTGSVLSSFF